VALLCLLLNRILCYNFIRNKNIIPNKQKMKFINDLNLKKQAENLGVKIWQTPGFLFIMLGIITVLVMTATYFISKNYDNPENVIIVESAVTIFIMVIGNAFIRIFEQIVRLNKMKSEFVSVASHQLRTPLSAIKWETELLLSKFKKGLNKKQLSNVENIEFLCVRMIKLVNDLLDVTRIEQKRLVLKKETIDLAKIVHEAEKEFGPIAKARNIELIFSYSKNISKIFNDANRLKMVVENLINNAVKYTTQNGKIEVKLNKKNNQIVFSVKDNGVGIPEEQQSRIFDKFFRSDNIVKYQTEGTGLGLYISKNIIEQLGGKIWFQSVENLGSIFSFSLPIKE
jgi:signal transduction histidine kinase